MDFDLKKIVQFGKFSQHIPLKKNLGLGHPIEEYGTSACLRSLKILPIEIKSNKILYDWKSLADGQNSKVIIYGRPFT